MVPETVQFIELESGSYQDWGGGGALVVFYGYKVPVCDDEEFMEMDITA